MSRLQVGLTGVIGYSSEFYFMNWVRNRPSSSGRSLHVNGVAYNDAQMAANGWVDENLELKNPLPVGADFYQEMFLNANATVKPDGTRDYERSNAKLLAGMKMKMTWDGGGNIVGAGMNGGTAVAENFSYTPGNNYCTWTNAVNAGLNHYFVNFLLNTATVRTPMTNVKIFRVENEQALNAGEIFEPAFISHLKQFKIIRYMDPLCANSQDPPVNFSDFAAESYRFWGDDGTTNGRKVGIPPTVLCKLINRSGVDAWINMGHRLTDAAYTEYATLLKNNVDPSIHLFIEWSNEGWNWQFPTMPWSMAPGLAIPDWSADVNYVAGMKYQGLRAAQMMEIFKTVFGTNSGAGRWTGLLGAQTGTNTSMDYGFVGADYHTTHGGSTLNQLFTSAICTTYMGTSMFTTKADKPWYGGYIAGPVLVQWADESVALDDNYASFNRKYYDMMKFSTNLTPAENADWGNIRQSRLMATASRNAAAARGLSIRAYEGGWGTATYDPLRSGTDGETDSLKIAKAIVQFSYTPYCAQLTESLFSLFLQDGALSAAQFGDVGLVYPWSIGYRYNDRDPRPVSEKNWNINQTTITLTTRTTPDKTPGTYSNTATYGSGAGAASYTITNANIGAATTTRVIVVGVCTYENAMVPNSCSVGGVSLALISGSNVSQNGIAFACFAGVVSSAQVAGTTANVVAGMPGGTGACCMKVYSLDGVNPTFFSKTINYNGGTGRATLIAVPESGICISFVQSQNNPTPGTFISPLVRDTASQQPTPKNYGPLDAGSCTLEGTQSLEWHGPGSDASIMFSIAYEPA